jgi:hypothetical protein
MPTKSFELAKVKLPEPSIEVSNILNYGPFPNDEE